MTTSKMTPEALVESIMNAQLARQHEFGSAIAGVNAEFTKQGRYGGGSWYAERNRVGEGVPADTDGVLPLGSAENAKDDLIDDLAGEQEETAVDGA